MPRRAEGSLKPGSTARDLPAENPRRPRRLAPASWPPCPSAPAAREAARLARRGYSGALGAVAAPGSPHALGDLGWQIRRAVPGQRDSSGASESAHAPDSRMARQGWRFGVGLGGARGSVGGGWTGGGELLCLLCISSSGLPSAHWGRWVSLWPRVAVPTHCAPASSLAQRAFLGRHLFATRSLLPQVCLGACEHSSARLSTRLQPAPPASMPPRP